MAKIISSPSGGSVTIMEEGSPVVTSANKIDLIGSSVVATQDGTDPKKANITISSSSSGSSNSYFPSGW